MSALTGYRQLDADKILATLTKLRDRIAERFPDSGLSRVAGELLALGLQTANRAAYLRQPHWPIRLGAAIALVAMIAMLLIIAVAVRLRLSVEGIAEFVQATNAAVGDVVFLGAAVFFLATLETRIKRRKALGDLYQLRSMAHIVDMHQLTKDPERMLSRQPDTASSPERTMTAAELGRYLGYCSELLSLISKLAALDVQQFYDPVVLSGVNEIEELTTGLTGKIWQKITLLNRAS